MVEKRFKVENNNIEAKLNKFFEFCDNLIRRKNAVLCNDNQKSKELMSRELWLSFFNEYLYKNGLITQEERLKMNTKITAYFGKFKKTAHK